MNVYEMSLQMLEKHFTPKLIVVFERRKFFSIVQAHDEDVMSYVAALRGFAVTCDFRDLCDSLMRDQIVRCTNNTKVKEVIVHGSDVRGMHSSSKKYGTHCCLDKRN
ncbi:hypothetical protein NDU88_004587 [Pleurodeles waltl]|uniref:Uncharacterized protein n=1 Tax=Pleurodeles waltl TaxID=8319 RepID=A0AAV7MXM7_PLEWA|nr:hypothetical protein NDU88_004587 [Pleurodeles waltl]